MMSLDFYRNIPKKKCCECEAEITEMHESYFNECEQCLNKIED